jgi:predicted dehydrogenase
MNESTKLPHWRIAAVAALLAWSVTPSAEAADAPFPLRWHAVMTVLTAQAGKDIYCEKPLSYSVAEGRKMVEAVRKHQRVLQTGSMYRSRPFSRFACELIRNGRIGQIQRVLTALPPGRRGPGPGWQPMPVPEGLDYDLWLGPAPEAPYHEDRCIYGFRFIRDYAGGQTTNFGAHCFGIVQWALDADNSGPVEFEDLGTTWPEPGDLYNVPLEAHFRARYASGVELICQTKELGFVQRFEGTEGWIEVVESGPHPGLKVFPESLRTTTFGPNEVRLPASVPSRPLVLEGRQVAHVYEDHARNFLDGVKTRQDPVEPVEAGHRTASLCHLANIAMRLRRPIRWNPHTEEIVDDAEASRMLSRPARAPWNVWH